MTADLLKRTRPPLTLRGWLRLGAAEGFFDRLPAGSRLLEIGPGLGALACRLAMRFDYTGIELDRASWAVAASRLERIGAGKVMHGDLSALDPGLRFDAVCAFEVLEHIEDDLSALRQWAGRLSDGGALLVSVPAFVKRFGASDVHVGHYRRYEPASLATLIQAAGFDEPELRVYGFPLDTIGEHAKNLVARLHRTDGALSSRTAASGRFLQPPDSLGWLTRAVTAPFRVLQRPFASSSLGTGLVAFARLRRD